MRHYRSVSGLLSLLLGSVSAQAQTADPPADVVQSVPADSAAQGQPAATDASATAEDQQAAAEKKKWEFYTIGYVWLATAKGKTDVIGPVPPVDLDLSLGDVIDAF